MSQPRINRLTYGNKTVRYRVVRSATRRRSVTIQIIPHEPVRVLVPSAMSAGRIRTLLARKAEWIIRKQEMPGVAFAPVREYVNGETFPYLGRHYRLRVHVRAWLRRPQVRLVGRHLEVTLPKRLPQRRSAIRRALFRWYKERAGEKLVERMHLFLPKLGLNRTLVVRVRDQTRRWGSCSTAGRLNFNWRIVMAPLSLVDYVVVHELCHMVHPNHSRAFWEHVRSVLPDYEERRARLLSLGATYDLR